MRIATRLRDSLRAPMARPALVAAATAFAVACSGGDGGGPAADVNPYLEDVVLGDAAAPVEIVEYASLTCPHCRDFWKQDFPRLKANYIDTGKVTYTLRDFPTAPAELAVAGTGIARCAGADGYYAAVDSFFDRFADIMDAARTGQAGPILVEIGAKHGLGVDEVRACVEHDGVREYIDRTIAQAQADGVTSTPAVFVNGERVSDHRYAALSVEIDAALGVEPEAAPAEGVAAEGGAEGAVPAPAQ